MVAIICLQEIVREAVSNVVGSVLDQTSVDVETQENTPRTGDMTLRVHVRGSAVRHIDSGALSRINFVSDGLNRSERTLQLLEVKISFAVLLGILPIWTIVRDSLYTFIILFPQQLLHFRIIG